jgi:hypothetical protein
LCGLLTIGLISTVQAQPPPDIGVLPEHDTFAHITMYENTILFYAVYQVRSKRIITYAVWNNTPAPIEATMTLKGRAPQTLVVRPYNRDGFLLTGAPIFMTPSIDLDEAGELTDANVEALNVGPTDRHRLGRILPSPFPLPTER